MILCICLFSCFQDGDLSYDPNLLMNLRKVVNFQFVNFFFILLKGGDCECPRSLHVRPESRSLYLWHAVTPYHSHLLALLQSLFILPRTCWAHAGHRLYAPAIPFCLTISVWLRYLHGSLLHFDQISSQMPPYQTGYSVDLRKNRHTCPFCLIYPTLLFFRVCITMVVYFSIVILFLIWLYALDCSSVLSEDHHCDPHSYFTP